MALKKSDLYRSLWQSCDELRGGMDPSQYKDYILTLLFMKYVTDKASRPDSLIEVPHGGSFDDMVAAAGKADIGDQFNKIIGRLADANDLRGVIDAADFNDDEKLGKGKEMIDLLGKLVGIFNDIDFSGSSAEGDDLLGDAYEYLMRHFATESGKSKGQFYTPAEVSRILARVVGIGPDTRPDQTVFDPACGSGSLLLKAADEAPHGLTIYGQEKDNATWALARMNAILHSYADHDIRKGNTITRPQFTDGDQLQTFDFLVVNPPFSAKSWSTGLENEYGRFDGFGRPPEKNGDYAFLLHVVKSMKPFGRAAVILPHGVLFRGHAEATIRRQLVVRGLIEGIIGLPTNLFYGTGIPACVVVLDKGGASKREGIFMINASDGFTKDGPKNRLRSQDIHKIVDVFNNKTEIRRYSRMVPLEEIGAEANGFNLNISRYIDSSSPEDIQDLNAHLHGGIPERDIDALSRYWDAFPSLRETLFKPNRPGYVDLAVDPTQVRAIVLGSDEFEAFAGRARTVVSDWFKAHRPTLEAIDADTRPSDLIAALSDDLLERFRPFPLLDEYDAYEQLMEYWHETAHDDVFLVMHDGWSGAAKPRSARIVGTDKNGKPKFEEAHLKIKSGRVIDRYVMDLVPPELIIASDFAEDASALDKLTQAYANAAASLDEYRDEHAVEDDPLWPAVDDKGKVTQKSIKAALKEARAERDDEAASALDDALSLVAAEASSKKRLNEAKAALDLVVLGRYASLTDDEVRSEVLDLKWEPSVQQRIDGVIDQLVGVCVGRLELMGARYQCTLTALEHDMATADRSLHEHLASLGLFQR